MSRVSTDVIGAVDIGGTKIAVGLAGLSGGLVVRYEVPTGTDFDKAMERVIELLSNGLRETGGHLLGIGIGCTGPVDAFTGVVGNDNFFPHWQGRSPVEALSEKFGVGVFVENDGDAAALGEAKRGAGEEVANLVCVTVGTGIGVGIVLDGQVYRGARGVHPEPGHHIVEPSGPTCTCGARGCWESLASGPAISDWYKKNTPEAQVSPITTTEDLCTQARKGDTSSLRAIERGGFYLGIGLANLITIFAPDVIALGGSVMKSADLFLDRICKTIHETCKLVPACTTIVRPASLGVDLGLIGAAEVWRYRMEQKGEQV